MMGGILGSTPGRICLLTFVSALLLFIRTGGCQNITTAKGGPVSFPRRPYKQICQVTYLGKWRNELKGKEVFFSHGPELTDMPFSSYEERLDIRSNCTSVLQNVQAEDEGWYRVTYDLGQMPDQIAYYYLRVVDPVCNVSIMIFALENTFQVRLFYNLAEAVESINCTHNGKHVPESQSLPRNLILEEPINQLSGLYECPVQRGKTQTQVVSIHFIKSDPMCNVKSPLKDTMVLCNVTGSVKSINLTHNGKSVPVKQTLLGNQSLEVLMSETRGLVECQVQCNNQEENGWSEATVVIIISVVGACLVMRLLLTGLVSWLHLRSHRRDRNIV